MGNGGRPIATPPRRVRRRTRRTGDAADGPGPGRRRRRAPLPPRGPPPWLPLLLLSLLLPSLLPTRRHARLLPGARAQPPSSSSSTAAAAPPVAAEYVPVDPDDGPANLVEGRRLFGAGKYGAASAHFWRAVMLHGQSSGGAAPYDVDDAFDPFLRCYLLEGRLVDGLVFVAAEGYLRGQDEMGELYLGQALGRDGGHAGASELRDVVAGDGEEGTGGGDGGANWKFKRLKAIRDRHDASHPDGRRTAHANANDGVAPAKRAAGDRSPEDLYDLGAVHFNAKNFPLAAELFELSCVKSDRRLSVACTNAVYLRSNVCDWGHLGEGFERDMRIVEEVTRAEAEMFRTVVRDVDAEAKRLVGLGHDGPEGAVQWRRSTSVHPHMMLGYPLPNEHAVLKRYAAESLAGLDELRARADNDAGVIAPRPDDLPYSVEEMRAEHRKKRLVDEGAADDGTGDRRGGPIKVGFVACSFNSKAVLFLSHDMFRFFDPDVVEVHVFSTGPPDNPRFIEGVMRGVDWRRRVVDSVDHFHDAREYQSDHIGLARYIHEKGIQILIEWDGYARQGERSAGLMALRPAPIQILHQEFLLTSGAQFFDYIVTDRVVSPPRLEGLYTEKFLYLPNHFFSKGHAVQKEVLPPQLEYVPKEKGAEFELGVGSPQENACLSSNPLGADGDGGDRKVSFVYCNFNKFLKNNPETMRSWIRILREVPDSILCLLENPPEGVPNLRRFAAEVAAADGEADPNSRIHFLSWEKNPFDHQRRSYSLCNAMLDSHPYNGHTTAQDALYAGVPIVTRSDGDDMSSRVSTSANVVLGLEELNAHGGREEYEDIAIRLGSDGAWFRSLRERLVETCLQKNPMHPYWDVPRYVENFQKGLTLVWDRFLDGKEMDHVDVVEDVNGERKARGTTEAELVAKEEKRRKIKEKQAAIRNDEL